MKITESCFVVETVENKGSITEEAKRYAVTTGNVATWKDTDVDTALQEATRISDGLKGTVIKITEKKLAQFGLNIAGLNEAYMVTVDDRPVAIVGTWIAN